MLFLKSMHLKKRKEKLQKVLPENFSKQQFVSLFQRCFPCAWEDIVYFCNAAKGDYERRKRKGLKARPYMNPYQFLLRHVGKLSAGNSDLSEEERLQCLNSLEQEGKKKLEERKEALADNLIYVQEVCPSYVHDLIQTYFNTRKNNTLDINVRYLILLEAAQFRCKETIEFLYKINACEKNDDLRTFAFDALQRMGEHPWLARKRKGKQKMSQITPVDIKDNPTELMQIIASHQQYLFQRYDIFLSHSSRDIQELLKLKSILNSKGYTVYIDWVNDREMLKRENQDGNTWNVLYLRMDQSANMLYVMTDNSIQTKSTEKEVCYFKEKQKPVYFFQPGTISQSSPSYLNDCKEIGSIENFKL